VLLRDRVERAVRRWHSLELANGQDPVIDYDCAPTKEKLGYWTLDNSVDLHRRCSSTRWLPECRSSSLLSH